MDYPKGEKLVFEKQSEKNPDDERGQSKGRR